LQMLPKIAEGDANKLWIVPSEIGDALKGLSGAMGNFGGLGGNSGSNAPRGTEGKIPERREKPSID
ncbi:SPFH/Band 7/PHB domain protein, partial [Streptomyces sp. CAI-85]|nr:SPFH/Band 7/PHB domain protein [Streptomyces sp. CAI-85]